MVFHVIVVTFLVTLVMDEFYKCCHLSLHLLHFNVNYGNNDWYILHPNIHAMKSVMDDWNLEEKSCNTCQYLQHRKSTMTVGYCIRPSEKRWIWQINDHGKRSLYNRIKKYCIAVVETWATTYIAIPQHGPCSLHIELESPSITKLTLCLPWSIILVDLQGLLDFSRPRLLACV